jgi:uncharacterized membrane protein
VKRAADLSTPTRRAGPSIHYDPDAFGRFSEGIARYLGTAKFLVIQTVLVVIWITVNVVAATVRWDPYPFILLNLSFSTQAAYAAPLILLAQNRQDERDRAQVAEDRRVAARIRADTEYLATELASIRQSLADVVTVNDLRDTLDAIRDLFDAGTGSEPGESELPMVDPG